MKKNKKYFGLWSLVFGLCLGFSAQAQYVAIDPTRNIPNARVLGLGKAFIGLADDSGSMYTNPAGLTDAANWQFTSMSGKFLDEYQYLSFSGFYPTDHGVFGAAYAGYYVGGVYSTTVEAGSDPSDPIYTFDFSQPVMENRNEAIILSYANELEKISFLNRLPFADRFSLGANLKLFRAALTGDGITGGAGIASGQDFDLGLKIYPPQKWMKFGLTVQNLLPASMGGRLTYTAGHEESYPSILEGGSVFHVLGEEDALRSFNNQDLKFMLDFDAHPTLSGYPLVWHIGAEWKPHPIVSLRAALDQDAGGGGANDLVVYSDTAYGVGLNVQGLSFDYAYHTFAGAPSIDNHYFSLSYGLLPKKAVVPVTFAGPEDKSITFESIARVAGRVDEPAVSLLKINGIPASLGLHGEFSQDVSLNPGKNAIAIQALSEDNQKIVDTELRVLRAIQFPDVSTDYWVAAPISLLAMEKIVSGYPDGTFKPEGKINRAEMCALLMKTRGLETEDQRPKTAFKDVEERHWAASYIAQAEELGIVTGYPDRTFKPADNITRAEGLAMICRFAEVSQEAYADQFSDLKSNFWAAKIISGAYKAGILDYLKDKPFQYKRKLSRAETVEMLYRTQYVEERLKKDLLDWESY